MVEYDPGDGKLVNVHTKQSTTRKIDAILETRQVIGARSGSITVRGVSSHAVQRVQERNVTMDSIKDALARPLAKSEVKYDSEGRPSVTITGEKATVSINPDSGIITTVYPTHSKTAKRLKG